MRAGHMAVVAVILFPQLHIDAAQRLRDLLEAEEIHDHIILNVHFQLFIYDLHGVFRAAVEVHVVDAVGAVVLARIRDFNGGIAHDGGELDRTGLAVDGAEGDFPKMQSWGYVMGAYLAGDNPWDGYIELREDEVRFLSRRTGKMYLQKTSDTVGFGIADPIILSVRDGNAIYRKKPLGRMKLSSGVHTVFPTPESPQIITPPPITAVNVSNRKLYIELRNPVAAEEINTAAFTMIVTTSAGTVRLQPVSADFGSGNFGSTIWLTFGSSDMKDSIQSITLLYDGDVGNLTDVLNNTTCNSFQTSFMYVPFEEEEI